MTGVPSLEQAVALRTEPVQGKRGGVTVTPDWCAALAITDRVRSRFKRSADWATLTHGEQLALTLICVMDGVELIERRYAGYWNDLWCRVMDYVEAHRTEFAVPA